MSRKFLCLVLLTQLGIRCSNDSDGRIVLIPNGYKGIVTIIYGVKDGAKEEFENGKQVFRIPSNGVLKTQFSLDETWINSERIGYFYESRKRVRIERADFPNELPNNVIQIIGEQVGTTSDFPNTYLSFLVCTFSESDSLSRLRYNQNLKELMK